MDILMKPNVRRSPGNPFSINGQILKSLLSSVCPLFVQSGHDFCGANVCF